MLRTILGVVLGYFVMFALIFAIFSGLYLALGAEKTFEPGTYDPTTLWVRVSLVLGLLAAIVGGLVCAKLSKSRRATVALVAVVLALGALSAVGQMVIERPDPGVRTADVSNIDAMMKAQTPLWVAWANPVVGALGVLIGSRLARAKRS